MSIYLRHLEPVIAKEQLGHEIDLSAVHIDYLAHHQQPTTSGIPSAGKPLEPVKEAGKGKPHNPEMVALAEVIEKINDMYAGDHPESSVSTVITHLKDRLEESETLQQQAKNNTMAQFAASPDLQQEFTDAVLGAMDSSADLSTQILNNPDIFQKLLSELIPIIYKDLAATG